MGHQPVVIGGVAMKTAAKLIVDAAACHVLQGLFGHRQGVGLTAAGMIAQEEFQGHRGWELGRLAEAGVARIETGGQVLVGVIEHLGG